MTDERRFINAPTQRHLVPLPHRATTETVDNGWAGGMPLPVARFKDDLGREACNTAWKIPKRFHKLVKQAMAEDRLALSVLVIVGGDGKIAEMSVVVPKVELTRDQ